jgi:hypothetical protein
MNLLRLSGVALQAGNMPDYPTSHGCVRLQQNFSELLFGLTHLGTLVVIAGSHTQPEEVVHSGLVLGEYASHEFDKVKSGLKAKELPWAVHVTDYSLPTSILISSAGRTGTLLVDGKIIGQRPVVIRDPHIPPRIPSSRSASSCPTTCQDRIVLGVERDGSTLKQVPYFGWKHAPAEILQATQPLGRRRRAPWWRGKKKSFSTPPGAVASALCQMTIARITVGQMR